ncbi:MAG TPA: hypothetical protein VGJ29_03710 [Vicinamibacterales bacterium]|jgi:hypothetical protein
MLNALSLMSLAAALATAAASPLSSPRSANAFPPIGVTIIVGRGVAPTLVSRILDETDAIWRGSGFSFVWQRDGGLPAALSITIDNTPGVQLDGQTTLGWIHFDDNDVPAPEIHLSYANAMTLLELSRGVVGPLAQMPIAERETLLGRAMGRALAHEMGHYLLASKAHTPKGLMATKRSAIDLFNSDRAHFRIDDGQRAAMAARLVQPTITADSSHGSRASKRN